MRDTVEKLKLYRNNEEYYLPMVAQARKKIGERNSYGDWNLGWDCGFIGRRPYFADWWASEGISMITVYLSADGIEDYSAEDLERLLIQEAGLYSKLPGNEYLPETPKFVDDNGKEFFSINIAVGLPEEPAIIRDTFEFLPYSFLNEFNESEDQADDEDDKDIQVEFDENHPIISRVRPDSILIKDTSLMDIDAPFYNWLREKGFRHAWHKGHYDNCDWAYVNITRKLFAYGMPGIPVTTPTGNHAITLDEFFTIYNIYEKYEDYEVLSFSERKKADEAACDDEEDSELIDFSIDEDLVNTWKQKLADGDYSYAISLGDVYKQGEVFERDINKAIEYYELAASKGIGIGNELIGELYFLGDGVEQDYKKTYEYFTRHEGDCSCAKPYYLGEMYRNGFYVEKDLYKAKDLFKMIIDLNSEDEIKDAFFNPALEKINMVLWELKSEE